MNKKGVVNVLHSQPLLFRQAIHWLYRLRDQSAKNPGVDLSHYMMHVTVATFL